MENVISAFSDGTRLVFDRGRFDDHCVYMVTPAGQRHAPRDTEYFKTLKELGDKYGSETVFGAFKTVYNLTGKALDTAVISQIRDIASGFDSDALAMEKVLTTLYAGMIAEENKAGTKLGKRIKCLGVQQVLLEKMDPEIAANYSKGKKWRDLDTELSQKGIERGRHVHSEELPYDEPAPRLAY